MPAKITYLGSSGGYVRWTTTGAVKATLNGIPVAINGCMFLTSPGSATLTAYAADGKSVSSKVSIAFSSPLQGVADFIGGVWTQRPSIDALNAQIAAQNAKIASMEASMGQLQASVTKLTADNAALASQLAAANAANGLLTTQLAAANATIADLRKQLAAAQQPQPTPNPVPTPVPVPGRLKLSSGGFSIDAGLLKTITAFSVGGQNANPTVNGNTFTYKYPNGWTAVVVATEDVGGVHFAVTFTNNTAIAAPVPEFTLLGLNADPLPAAGITLLKNGTSYETAKFPGLTLAGVTAGMPASFVAAVTTNQVLDMAKLVPAVLALVPDSSDPTVPTAKAFDAVMAAAKIAPVTRLQGMWKYSMGDVPVLDQVLADGTHVALVLEDPTFPCTFEFMQSTNPYNGGENLYFHPTGGQYTRYDLDIVPALVQPGASLTVKAALMFGPNKAAVSAPACAAWVKAYPFANTNNDHRMAGRGDMFQYDPTPANPQGFQGNFDVNDPANAQKFDDWIMAYAARVIGYCKTCNIGYWIEWCLVGKQLGNNYKGNPQLIEKMNPVWSRGDASGVKLITRFIKKFKDAGVHFGVCLRTFTLIYDPAAKTLVEDPTISTGDSVEQQIKFARVTYGMDAFYLDSPKWFQVPRFRRICLIDYPDITLIPEDVTEPWLQFCTPMVWAAANNINWVQVPRNLYGDDGWGFYYHQTLPDAQVRFAYDAKRGTSVMLDAWYDAGPGGSLDTWSKLMAAARAG